MGSLSKREKNLLFILLFLLIAFLYYNFIAIPELNKLSSETSILNNNKNILNGLIETQKNIDKIKKQVEDMNLQTEEYEKSIPDSSKIPEILMNFKTMLESSGCTGGRLAFGGVSGVSNNTSGQTNTNQDLNNKPMDIITIPITYQVNGNYDSIMMLLKSIENSNRKMIIDKILFTKSPDSNKLSVNLNINCFYIKTKQSGPINYPFIYNTPGKQNIFN